jgi:transcriptional regulator with XRE-family HTH domain
MGKNTELGKRIHAYRMERQMTQKQMAGFIGVTLATISRIERGEACLDLTKAKILKLLNGQEAA